MAKKKKKSSNLSGIRIKLQELANEANERVSQLTTDNYAVREAKRTLPKSRKDADVYFTGNLRNLKDLKNEYARIMAFMSDWRSTKEGSDFYDNEKTALEQYKGMFGGQWLKKYGETYNTEVIEKDFAERAFSLYDRLVEEYQSEDRAKMLWNKDSSKISYGSENMIIAIYDMVKNGFNDGNIMDMLRAKMETNYIELQRQAVNAASYEDYGQLGDYFSGDKSRKEILDELARRGF